MMEWFQQAMMNESSDALVLMLQTFARQNQVDVVLDTLGNVVRTEGDIFDQSLLLKNDRYWQLPLAFKVYLDEILGVTCWLPIDTNENSNELNYFELKYGKREVQTPQFFTPMGAPQTAGRLSQDNGNDSTRNRQASRISGVSNHSNKEKMLDSNNNDPNGSGSVSYDTRIRMSSLPESEVNGYVSNSKNFDAKVPDEDERKSGVNGNAYDRYSSYAGYKSSIESGSMVSVSTANDVVNIGASNNSERKSATGSNNIRPLS